MTPPVRLARALQGDDSATSEDAVDQHEVPGTTRHRRDCVARAPEPRYSANDEIRLCRGRACIRTQTFGERGLTRAVLPEQGVNMPLLNR